jgi:hypothetical protein
LLVALQTQRGTSAQRKIGRRRIGRKRRVRRRRRRTGRKRNWGALHRKKSRVWWCYQPFNKGVVEKAPQVFRGKSPSLPRRIDGSHL